MIQKHCFDQTVFRRYCITLILVLASVTLILGQVHDDSKTTTTTTTISEEETIRIRSSSSGTTDIQYHPPFTTQYYPQHVVDALQQYPKTTVFVSDDNEDDDDDSNVEEMRQLELASWYVDLGIAHRTVMEDYYIERLENDNDIIDDTNRAVHTKMNDMDHESSSSSSSSTTNSFIRIQKAYSVSAFQEAMYIYETLIQNYRQWLESYIEKNNDEYSIQEKSVAATTKNIIQQLIQEYDLLLANTIFALAETYTLVNDDTRLAFRYYHRAYQIYQKQHPTNQFTPKAMEHDNKHDDYQSDNSDRNMDIHFAHCSMQLGLESLQNLHDSDHDMMEYDENDEENHVHITLSLSDVMEKSVLIFDHHFWKTLITSFPWKDDGDDDDKNRETMVDDIDNDTQIYTRELVQDYLRNHYIEFFNNDVIRIEMYILQYILTEQAIVYFTDAIHTFRQVIQQQQLSTSVSSGGDAATTTATSRHNMIIEHQQTLVSALQNLATCLYEYRPLSSTISKAVEYYEEAYDILSFQIMPSMLLYQPIKENHHGSNEDVKRTVHTMIDILFILTEMYFQLGDDELSKERMQLCLQHHEEYQLDPPSVDPLLHGSTTMIEEMLIMNDNETPMSRKDLLAPYEQLLAEYYALVADNDIQQNSMNDDQMLLMDESNGYYYEKDDSYEADIHVSIGTLYMEELDKVISTSSITHAMTHFEQAVRLYEMSGDVDSNTNMALAKYNLFLLHLRGGNYRMAARRYNDAIDLFRNIESHSTDVTGMDESFKDPTLFTGSVNLHQHRSKRVQEPYQSSKQQHKTLTKSEASTTRTTSPTARAIDEETKHNVESATLPVVKEKPSLYVDLQNFLSQNQSAKEEL